MHCYQHQIPRKEEDELDLTSGKERDELDLTSMLLSCIIFSIINSLFPLKRCRFNLVLFSMNRMSA